MRKSSSCRALFLSLAALGWLSPQAQAQGFIQPAPDRAIVGDCQVTTAEGREVTGRIRSKTRQNSFLRKLSIHDESGNKVKYSAADILELKVRVGKLQKLRMISVCPTDILKLLEADFDEIVTREYIIFERALRPKKDQYGLFQLINPGFDSKIKVYDDPSGFKSRGEATGWRWTDHSFVVVKEGEKSFLLKKKLYQDQFEQVFGDCPEVLKHYSGAKPRFEDFAQHVFVYDQLCK
jgi:hypothetical protein